MNIQEVFWDALKKELETRWAQERFEAGEEPAMARHHANKRMRFIGTWSEGGEEDVEEIARHIVRSALEYKL